MSNHSSKIGFILAALLVTVFIFCQSSQAEDYIKPPTDTGNDVITKKLMGDAKPQVHIYNNDQKGDYKNWNNGNEGVVTKSATTDDNSIVGSSVYIPNQDGQGAAK